MADATAARGEGVRENRNRAEGVRAQLRCGAQVARKPGLLVVTHAAKVRYPRSVPSRETVPSPEARESASGPEHLVTVREAADVLHIGRSLLYALMGTGQLSYIQIGRTRRIRPSDLTKLMADHTVGAPIE